jgi:hypothetical protein
MNTGELTRVPRDEVDSETVRKLATVAQLVREGQQKEVWKE